MKNIYFFGIMLLTALFSVTGYAKNNEYGVLAYHSVVDETNKAGTNYYYPQTISVQHLIQHFNWLKENDYHVVSWQQIIDAEKGSTTLPDKAVLLSFDDGYETMYSVIFPLLKAYHYPAVFAPVASWINAPKNAQIPYSNTTLPRSTMTTWEHIKEMYQSRLVEIASHSYNQHYGHPANPAGSQLPAIIAAKYENGKYETKDQYIQRIEKDFKESAKDIKRAIGKSPQIMVWPYGNFTTAAMIAASKAGMSYSFSLDDDNLNKVGEHNIGRLLLDQETSFDAIKEYLTTGSKDSLIIRATHVKLDDIYNPNLQLLNKNIDSIIEKIHRSGTNIVYLQAYSDENQDNIADALYFPNAYLPVKADLFSRIAWSLFTRAGVKVYAEMPIMAFNLPQANNKLEAIKSIYNDLSYYAKFSGVLFNDQTLASEHPAEIIKLTNILKKELETYAMIPDGPLNSAYNLNIDLKNYNKLENNLEQLSANYGQILLSVNPDSEDINANDVKTELTKLISYTNNNKQILFDFSSSNNKSKGKFKEPEIISWIKLLEKHGIYSFGYKTDDFSKGYPSL